MIAVNCHNKFNLIRFVACEAGGSTNAGYKIRGVNDQRNDFTKLTSSLFLRYYSFCRE